MVVHDQSDSLTNVLGYYERSLASRNLPDIPFHAAPLMRGYDQYKSLDMGTRKKLLASFGVLVQRLPIQYKSFAFKSKEFKTVDALQIQLKRKMVDFLFDEIGFFQSFDVVKVYYDNGQTAVTAALHAALEYVLSKDVPLYRDSSYKEYRLAQAADYLCEIELAAIKYENHDETQTDVKFFGGAGTFKKNWLKQARRKLIKRQYD